MVDFITETKGGKWRQQEEKKNGFEDCTEKEMKPLGEYDEWRNFKGWMIEMCHRRDRRMYVIQWNKFTTVGTAAAGTCICTGTRIVDQYYLLYELA